MVDALDAMRNAPGTPTPPLNAPRRPLAND